MPIIEIVENPKAKRRVKRRKTVKHRRTVKRRNPLVASLTNPKRRRRKKVARKRYSRRRNPKFGIGSLINIENSAAVAAGFIVSAMAPALVSKVWVNVPRTGPVSYIVRAGSTIMLAYGVNLLTRKKNLAIGIATGGIAYILYDLANYYLLPKLGLSGLYDDKSYLTMSELDQIGVSGYQQDYGVSGYRPDYGVSGYNDITDEAMAA